MSLLPAAEETDETGILGRNIYPHFHGLVIRRSSEAPGDEKKKRTSGSDKVKNSELHTSAFKDDSTSISLLSFVVNSES